MMTVPSSSRRQRLFCLLCSAFLVLCVPGRADLRAAEVRDFLVFVGGKPAGSYRITIAANAADGKTLVTEVARVRVRISLINYTYTYDGTEVWQGDRLERAEATAVERGKATRLQAVVHGDKSATITVNGRAREDLPCSWANTHWCLPLFAQPGRPLAILDMDTGNRVSGRLDLIETVQLRLAGQVRTCKHYRVSGGDQAELWFDENNRLVRQQTIEDGHRTELRLNALRQDTP
jgi:hypothetical protein